MNTVSDKHKRDFKDDMAAIRRAVETLPDPRLSWNEQEAVDLIDQGNRMIQCLENWLLDDEQKQVLSALPRDMFILFSSCYLHDIGLTVSHGSASMDVDFKDHRKTGSFIRAVFAKSSEMIRENWQELNISSNAIADIIARVCLQAGNAFGDNHGVDDSEAAAIEGTAVNVPLLAACLALCRALDLRSPMTRLQIYSRMPEDSRMAIDRMKAHFKIVDVGSHPYINGTIRLKIHCSHPEIHRALKQPVFFLTQCKINC